MNGCNPDGNVFSFFLFWYSPTIWLKITLKFGGDFFFGLHQQIGRKLPHIWGSSRFEFIMAHWDLAGSNYDPGLSKKLPTPAVKCNMIIDSYFNSLLSALPCQ